MTLAEGRRSRPVTGIAIKRRGERTDTGIVWSWFSFGTPSGAPRPRGARAERFRTNLLSTNLGEVVDISASGARVRTPRRSALEVGQIVPLTIKSPQCKVVVHCRVVRAGRASGARGFDVSLAFLDAKPALRAAIAHLGRFGFIPRMDIGGASEARPGPRPRKPLPDYYGVLGVMPNAPAEEIRRAYHALAKQHHPDHSQNANSVGVFESLVQAYNVLRDPARRSVYDAEREAHDRTAA